MFYVYTLTDPRNDAIFYIGKGTRNRLHDHTRQVKTGSLTSNAKKSSRIQDILADGYEPIASKVARFSDEAAAFEHERYLISVTPGLTNIRAGGGWALAPEVRERNLQLKAEKLARHKEDKTMQLLKNYLYTWSQWSHGVTFPHAQDGDAMAREYVATVRRMVDDWTLRRYAEGLRAAA